MGKVYTPHLWGENWSSQQACLSGGSVNAPAVNCSDLDASGYPSSIEPPLIAFQDKYTALALAGQHQYFDD